MTDVASAIDSRTVATAYRVQALGVSLAGVEGQRTVLQDVTFDVACGEIVAVVGRSGTGKTTLLRVLAGLLGATTGTVTVRGVPVREPPEGVAMVFQDYHNALLPWRTVARNVAIGLEHRTGRRERQAAVDHALRSVGLHDRGSEFPWRLSGGMAQRVQLARALAMDATVLLMDEPFGALDAITKAGLQDILLDLHARAGSTIVFVTHDLDEALYLSDRVLVIRGNPGTIATSLPTNLPWPRDQLATRALPGYIEARNLLGQALGADGDG